MSPHQQRQHYEAGSPTIMALIPTFAQTAAAAAVGCAQGNGRDVVLAVAEEEEGAKRLGQIPMRALLRPIPVRRRSGAQTCTRARTTTRGERPSYSLDKLLAGRYSEFPLI